MEPEGSLSHSQEPASCPYSEPDQSSPYSPSHFLKTYVHIILPSMSRLHMPNLISLSHCLEPTKVSVQAQRIPLLRAYQSISPGTKNPIA